MLPRVDAGPRGRSDRTVIEAGRVGNETGAGTVRLQIDARAIDAARDTSHNLLRRRPGPIRTGAGVAMLSEAAIVISIRPFHYLGFIRCLWGPSFSQQAEEAIQVGAACGRMWCTDGLNCVRLILLFLKNENCSLDCGAKAL